MTAADNGDLAGRRVLVVEDEFFIANDLKRALAARGATIVGPVGTLARAGELVADQPVDFAILDINLKGEMVFPLIEMLRERGIRFVFATGYDAAMVPSAFQDIERWEKPVSVEQVVAKLIDSV